ncbi:MAG: hypothetical protein LUF30_00840, partial [Lachnospiraceae bacterium]|nr:hypothetical protein [Lachnospiraceae bacterium]
MVACEFELTYDTLEGISVKFQADGTFDEEELWAGLYDADTGELLAECVIELKNERIQNSDSGSTIYFSLPVSGTAGLKVRVVFELRGEEIQTCPSFVTSKNAATESELYVNGEARKKNLVFTARYSLGTSRDAAQAVLNGILYLAVGTVVFLWFYRRPGSIPAGKFETGANLESADRHSSRIWKTGERLCAFIRENARILGYFLLIGCLCALLLYVYMYEVRYPSLAAGM